MSLTNCVKKAGDALHPTDKADIFARAGELRRDGVGTAVAGRTAVDEQLAAVQAMIAKAPAAQPEPAPPEDRIRTALTLRFGDLIGRMEARGFLKIWANSQAFNQGQPSKQIRGLASGFYDGQTVHLFANGIQTGEEMAVFLHEAGEHAAMESMLGPKVYADLVNRANTLVAQNDATALEAKARIPLNTNPAHLDSELLAYMIETAAAQGAKVTPSARKWLADAVAAIRAWWMTTGLNQALATYGKGIELTPQDIAALAVRAVKYQSTAELGLPLRRGPMYSHGTNDPMTNKDVVGNQGGRFADDNSPGDIDESTGLPLNKDGTVTVYHHTSAKAAEAIRQTGALRAQAEPDVYVTTRRETDTGYGDTAVPINVRPDQISIDDEFPDGRKDFRLNVGRPGGSIKVTVPNEPTAPDSGGARGQFSRPKPASAATQAASVFGNKAQAQSQQAVAPVAPAPKGVSWRDATGRFQVAPTAWLYEKLAGAAVPWLARIQMNTQSPELKKQIRQMKLDVQAAQETAISIAKDTAKMSAGERRMVSDIIEKELATGLVPPAHAVKLAATMSHTMSLQSAELVRLGMLSQEAATRWDGAYLPRFYESKIGAKAKDAWAEMVRALSGRTSAMKGIRGRSLNGRGLYETVSVSDLENYESLGWQVRDPDFDAAKDQEVQVWRDYTRAERDKMGEIRDAGFRFVTGYMQTQKDIALGHLFEGLASTVASRLEKPGFVRVPDTKVPGTGASRYGKLAGMYVPIEVATHLSQFEESANGALQMYRRAMGLWKEGKTVLNPVSHVNNVVSNMSMAHFGGVGYHRADKYLSALKDFVNQAPELLKARDAGLFLGSMSDAELMNTLPPELQLIAKHADSATAKGAKFVYDAMTWFLRKPMGAAYAAEDTFFRYLLYKDAHGRGMTTDDAVDYAQRYIFTYDDLPKGARMIRDFGIPFFSYTYKAIPALLHTATHYPHRLAAPAAVLWLANAAAYAIATGADDDEAWGESLEKYLNDADFRKQVKAKEDLERENLPPWMKGVTSLLSPKAIRLGMDEVTKLPLFLDVSRIVPGGDIFDVSPNAGGLPLPQPITPSHPLFTTAVAMLANKDLYFGKDLVDSNDTSGERLKKRSEWLWKQMSPAITAGNYHWERGMNAIAQASGGTVSWLPEAIAENYTGIGKDGLPVQPALAVAQTFGIKLRPIDLDKSEQITEGKRAQMIRQIDTEIKALQRLNGLGAISDRVTQKAEELGDLKKSRLRDGLTVDGKEKD